MPTHGKFETNIELKTNADKFWGAIREFATVFPNAFPNNLESIEVIEGDGKAVGSLYQITTSGKGWPFAKTFRERIDTVDDAKKIIIFDVAAPEGNILQHCKKMKEHINVIPKGNGSMLKVVTMYEKPSHEDPEPTILKEIEVQTYQALDTYLQKA